MDSEKAVLFIPIITSQKAQCVQGTYKNPTDFLEILYSVDILEAIVCLQFLMFAVIILSSYSGGAL